MHSPSSSETPSPTRRTSAKRKGTRHRLPEHGGTLRDHRRRRPDCAWHKNSCADGFVSADSTANTHVAINPGLQQNTDMRPFFSGHGLRSGRILDRPRVNPYRRDVFSARRTGPLNSAAAVPDAPAELKKYGPASHRRRWVVDTRATVPCDLAIVGVAAAGKNLTRSRDGRRDPQHATGNLRQRRGTCSPRNFGPRTSGRVATETFGWYVVVLRECSSLSRHRSRELVVDPAVDQALPIKRPVPDRDRPLRPRLRHSTERLGHTLEGMPYALRSVAARRGCSSSRAEVAVARNSTSTQNRPGAGHRSRVRLRAGENVSPQFGPNDERLVSSSGRSASR